MNNTIRIIGTCHCDTKGFKMEDLYNLLCKIKPDVILCEFPIDDEVGIMDWLKACANHYKKRGGGESAAILRYLEDNQAEVLPYDIKGRNDFFRKKKYFEKEQTFGKVYNAYFKRPDAEPAAVKLNKFKKNLTRIFGFYEFKDPHTLADINTGLCDIRVETYIKVNAQLSKAIFSLVPEFSFFRKDYGGIVSFHAKRDKAMVTNILNYNKQFEGISIVVICGYFHRYALIDALQKKQKSDSFELITSL